MCLLLIVLTAIQALAAYGVSYQSFQGIVFGDKVKIEDSDSALQAIAQVSTDALDSVITQNVSTSQHLAAKAIDTDFATFRQDLFKVQADLSAGPETDAFNVAAQAIDDTFWPQLNAMLLSTNPPDLISHFSTADQALAQTVIPNLTAVEQYNFAAMQRTEQAARADIAGQWLISALLAIGTAVLLTTLSFWLRNKLRRLLTPAVDAAMVIGWLCTITLLLDLAHAPDQLKSMVEDSYFSVSATQHIIAIATQANRTESAEVLDTINMRAWQTQFDQNDMLIEQAICGYNGCINTPFTTLYTDTIDSVIVSNARKLIANTPNAIVPVVPLVANVTYADEPQAIEQIRVTYKDYLTIDAQIRTDLAQNQIAQAARLDTGESDVAFNTFVAAVQREQQINADQFDRVWQDVQGTLPAHRLLIGVGGGLLMLIGVCYGVSKRYREM